MDIIIRYPVTCKLMPTYMSSGYNWIRRHHIWSIKLILLIHLYIHPHTGFKIPYMGEIALDGYFSKILSLFFATLTAVFKPFLYWFDCFNYFYRSITCAGVGKTKFLTRHLRLGTWKKPSKSSIYAYMHTFHRSNSFKTPINTLQTTFKSISFFRSKNSWRKINRDFIKGGRGGSPFYEVISQKKFTNGGLVSVCFL